MPRKLAKYLLSFLGLFPTAAFAQRLTFVSSDPIVDSFPLVKIKILVNVNDSIPSLPLTSSDFTITEDGANVSALLSGCDESQNADVIICLDHSTSMIGSAGDLSAVSKLFLKSFLQLPAHLSSESRYALIPFIDSADTPFPRPPHTGAYYKPGNKADSIDFMKALNGLTFEGGTNIDASLAAASYILQFSFAPNKAIVLVTDDIIRSPDSMARLLLQSGIKLFVLEVGKDNAEWNFNLARKTGGTYYQASDSLMYASYMLKIAELITSEHCTLSYHSPLNCPWNEHHSVSVRLDAGSLSKTNWHDYVLPRTPSDSVAPALAIRSPLPLSRTLTAIENYPCESGLSEFRDSIIENFQSFPLERTFPFGARDSLVVVDPSKPARAVYVAIDSFFNRSSAAAYYFPTKDTGTIAPFLASAEFVDFGTRTAPTDTSVSISIINPNNKTLTIDKIVRNGATGTITSDLATPLIFQPLDSQVVKLRFQTGLLGDFNAKYDIYVDTLNVCSISGTGKTTGVVRIRIDTAFAFTGDTGTLNLSFDATPKPINLDTLSFYLRYDGDLIEFHPDLPDCSGGNPLCDYAITYTQVNDSLLRVDLIRTTSELHPTLNFSTATLPLSFQSFITSSTSSLVTLENMSVSQGCITITDTGLVRVNDRCGDDFIRSYALNTQGLTIKHVSPNPASKDLRVISQSGTDCTYTLRIYNSLGVQCLSRQAELHHGINTTSIETKDLPSGHYILIMNSKDGTASVPLIISQ